MTYEEINEMMADMGLPYAYHHFAEGESPQPPGAVSLSIDANDENENFFADDSVYYVINNNSGYDDRFNQ